jgi:hypothetical protein
LAAIIRYLYPPQVRKREDPIRFGPEDEITATIHKLVLVLLKKTFNSPRPFLHLRILLVTSSNMSPPADGSMGKRESGVARILGSGASGVAELMVFHPVVSRRSID